MRHRCTVPIVRFSGRQVLVVGGASGIGRATVELIAAEGASVAIADVDLEAAELVSTGHNSVSAFEVDLAEVESIVAMVADVSDSLGAPEIVIQAAGWDSIAQFVDTSPEFWDRVLAINLRGPMAVAHAVLPAMIERGGGALVFVSSDAGRVGSSGEVVYSAAKGGTIAFAKGLAREVSRHSIRVNCVAPRQDSDRESLRTEC
jgi:2-hydroxycyclohexanecarboxyl-CoA dehydrogenase